MLCRRYAAARDGGPDGQRVLLLWRLLLHCQHRGQLLRLRECYCTDIGLLPVSAICAPI